jgi:hypothetical protein
MSCSTRLLGLRLKGLSRTITFGRNRDLLLMTEGICHMNDDARGPERYPDCDSSGIQAPCSAFRLYLTRLRGVGVVNEFFGAGDAHRLTPIYPSLACITLTSSSGEYSLSNHPDLADNCAGYPYLGAYLLYLL